jgi:hypothetical protein
MRAAILLGVAFVPLCFSPSAIAQDPTLPEIAKRAKAATALVEVAGGYKHGSAFCVHEFKQQQE